MIYYVYSKISNTVIFIRIYKAINLSKLYYITFYKDIFKVFYQKFI